MPLYNFFFLSARPAPNSKPHSITGRDSYIIAEALYRCIATEQAKSDREQSWSNLQGAIAIFNAVVDAKNACFFADQYPSVTVSLIDEKAPQSFRIDPDGALYGGRAPRSSWQFESPPT
jgi:hypothetical protein